MIVVICGPTAVGKTKLSETLAKKMDAIIINGDAMQVYKNLDIGTAKVTKEEMEDVPHYLFDIAEVNENYTVYHYQKDARKIIEENKNKNIIIVGGTGLYIKAALYNYEFEERKATKEYEEYSNKELFEMLQQRNINDVHINNRRRLISRLNSSCNCNHKDELLYENTKFIGLTTDRNILYDKINKRVDEMIKNGLVEEVKRVYKEYGKTKALMTGIGYKEIISYIDGKITLEEAIELIKQKSRKYAKRQYTWFNNQMDIKWFETNYDDFDSTISAVVDFLDKI